MKCSKRLMRLCNEFDNQRGVYAIKDDHGFFSKHLNNSSEKLCGKLLLIDSTDIDTHHIFFDDNIQLDEAFIVDIWDMANKKRIKFKDAMNIYLCQADTIQAIADCEFFIKKTKECLQNRANILGLPLAECYANDKHCKQKWYCEKSDRSLSPEKYLEKNIYPKLIPAINALQHEHSDDPLSFLTMQLLEESGKSKKIRRN